MGYRTRSHSSKTGQFQSLKSTNERFWSNVEIKEKNDCWNWKGAKFPSGFGVFNLSLSIDGTRKNVPVHAHRFSYKLKHPETPKNVNVLHTCENKSCVNPRHLDTVFFKNVNDSKLILKLRLSCNGKNIVFPVPLSLNQKVIDFCQSDKVKLMVSNKGKSISFVIKASKFGSVKNGDRRIFKIPLKKRDKAISLCGTDTVKVTLQRIKPS